MDKNEDLKTKNYNLVTDLHQVISRIKNYESAYSNPGKGKMIIKFKDQNYMIDITPLGEGSIEDMMKKFNYIFKN